MTCSRLARAATPPIPAHQDLAHNSPVRTLFDQLISGASCSSFNGATRASFDGASRSSFDSRTQSLHSIPPSPAYGVSPYQPLAPSQSQFQHPPAQLKLESHDLSEPYPLPAPTSCGPETFRRYPRFSTSASSRSPPASTTSRWRRRRPRAPCSTLCRPSTRARAARRPRRA
jgi:hypothetical protein